MDEIPLSCAVHRAGAAAGLFGLLFDGRNRDDGLQPPSACATWQARGIAGAKLALDLLGRTDKMLGVILLGNNLLNAVAATLVSVITIELFGEEKWALSIGTLLVTFAILVFAEITPKILGAAHADQLARDAGLPDLAPAASRLSGCLVRQPVRRCPALAASPQARCRRRELAAQRRGTALPGAGVSNFIPQQHRSILLNLFELEQLTVADIMTPRGEIEAIDIAAPIEAIKAQLATSFHTRVAVFENDPANIIGVLHQSGCWPRPSPARSTTPPCANACPNPISFPPRHRSTRSSSSFAKTGSAWAWWWMNTARSRDW
jgi:Mg2+/Co2+ transporter CorB